MCRSRGVGCNFTALLVAISDTVLGMVSGLGLSFDRLVAKILVAVTFYFYHYKFALTASLCKQIDCTSSNYQKSNFCRSTLLLNSLNFVVVKQVKLSVKILMSLKTCL